MQAVLYTHGPENEEQRARSIFYVLCDGDGVVGTVAIHPGKGGDHQAGGPADSSVAVLARFGLSPALRGRGIGQRLYMAAENYCLVDGEYSKMWLETSRRQTAARVVYERNGWTLLESIDNAWEDDLMGKDLLPCKTAAI
jgi:GNAT superfamily N-acetyltransferase